MFALWGIYVCKQLEGVYLKGAYLWELCTHTIPKPATHVHSTCAIGGGTRGGAPGARLPPPLQTVWYGDLFDHTPSLEHMQWMAQQSLNMASNAAKTLGPSILAASSPNINLHTNMASEAISEYLILNVFLGEHAPAPP